MYSLNVSDRRLWTKGIMRLSHDGEIEHGDPDEKRKNDQRQREHEIEIEKLRIRNQRTIALITLFGVIFAAIVPVISLPSSSSDERQSIFGALIILLFDERDRVIEPTPIPTIPEVAAITPTLDGVATSVAATLTAIAPTIGVTETTSITPSPTSTIEEGNQVEFPDTSLAASNLFGGDPSMWRKHPEFPNAWEFRAQNLIRITVPDSRFCMHYPGGDDIGYFSIEAAVATIYYLPQGYAESECVDTSQ